jgi:hypothetical protein
MNTVMNLRVSLKAGNFLTSRVTVIKADSVAGSYRSQ